MMPGRRRDRQDATNRNVLNAQLQPVRAASAAIVVPPQVETSVSCFLRRAGGNNSFSVNSEPEAAANGGGNTNGQKDPLDYGKAEPGPSAAQILGSLVAVAASILCGLVGAGCITIGLIWVRLALGPHLSGEEAPHALIEGLVVAVFGGVLIALSYRGFRAAICRRK